MSLSCHSGQRLPQGRTRIFARWRASISTISQGVGKKTESGLHRGTFPQEVKKEWDKLKEMGPLPERKRETRVRGVCVCLYTHVCVFMCVHVWDARVRAHVWGRLREGVIGQMLKHEGNRFFSLVQRDPGDS